eukprot:scaffold2951_cov99-Isochrysis_galbana.AAC.7
MGRGETSPRRRAAIQRRKRRMSASAHDQRLRRRRPRAATACLRAATPQNNPPRRPGQAVTGSRLLAVATATIADTMVATRRIGAAGASARGKRAWLRAPGGRAAVRGRVRPARPPAPAPSGMGRKSSVVRWPGAN